MAACSVLKRSVLHIDGKSFDVVLSQTSLSWGHVGIEEYGLGKEVKYFYIIFNTNKGTIQTTTISRFIFFFFIIMYALNIAK